MFSLVQENDIKQNHRSVSHLPKVIIRVMMIIINNNFEEEKFDESRVEMKEGRKSNKNKWEVNTLFHRTSQTANQSPKSRVYIYGKISVRQCCFSQV